MSNAKTAQMGWDVVQSCVHIHGGACAACVTRLLVRIAETLPLVCTREQDIEVPSVFPLRRRNRQILAPPTPTREQVAALLFGDPAFGEQWEESLAQQFEGAAPEAREWFLRKADAVLALFAPPTGGGAP